MFNIFKKSKPKQKIIWDYIPVRPSTKAFNFEGGKDLKDYLIPTREILPKWFRSLKQTTSYFTMFPNVRTCPSFIDLFKDSKFFNIDTNIEVVTATGMMTTKGKLIRMVILMIIRTILFFL